MKAKTILLIGTGIVAGYLSHRDWPRSGPQPATVRAGSAIAAAAAVRPASPRSGVTVESAHYAISSTATPSQTAQVAKAVESLHDAYFAFFDSALSNAPRGAKLKLVLYGDQQEFKAHNKSNPWAEAFYSPPTCYAYFDEEAANPYHWMIHEATHQLNDEVAHLPRSKWINEGLASYFGTSVIRRGKLVPGTIDVHSYPIWWLSSLELSGDLQADLRNGTLIPLRALISNSGPDIDQHVNLYYIEYWSLSHFLFHYQNGRYADRYRSLLARGGSLEDFERVVGPVDVLQAEWYAYLRQTIAEVEAVRQPASDAVTPIVEVSPRPVEAIGRARQ